MTAELLLVGFATRDRARDQPAHSWRVGGLDIRPLCSAEPWVRWARCMASRCYSAAPKKTIADPVSSNWARTIARPRAR